MRLDSFATPESHAQEYVTPFAGMTETSTETVPASEQASSEESPFEGFSFEDSPFAAETFNEIQETESAVRDFLESMRDEDFEDALEELVNEGAARSLADAQQWSVAPSEAESREALEQWLAPLISEWERTMDGFAAGLENAHLESMPELELELEQLLESLETESPFESEVFGRALKALARKAKGLIKTVVQAATNPLKTVGDLAKKGLGAVASGVKGLGKFVLGPLLRRLKNIGIALLKGVLRKLVRPLTRILPSSIRPLVPLVTKALGIGEAGAGVLGELGLGETGLGETGQGEVGFVAELAHAFDSEIAAMLFAPEAGEDLFEQLENLENLETFENLENLENLETFETFETFENLESYESWESAGTGNELADLDAARARLAGQLGEHSGAESPVGPIQEFLPALLAIRPLLRLGLQVTGARSRLIDLLAKPLAGLIRSTLGPANLRRMAMIAADAPERIARAGVGVGFTFLGLETSASTEQGIPGEALASAIEATAMRVLDELSAEELSDPLQVSAAVQRLFAEAAAAYLPDRMMRPDLPELETAQEGGMWVMMPRSTGPRYRFRKYTRVMMVPITRQAARVLPWRDGGTLEQYLLDLGVARWPVQAEVDLYESMPGTLIGHLTRDETLPTGENPSAQEFQPLTPEVAGILLGECGLGRPAPLSPFRTGPVRVAPGQRYYRVRVGQFQGRRTRRPSRQVSVRWDPARRRMRVAVRLSERRARLLQAQLQRSAPAGQRDLPAVLTALRAVLRPRLEGRILNRLLRSSRPADRAAAGPLAVKLSAAAMSGLSGYLVQRSAHLAAAVANSAEGVTIILTFNGVSANSTVVPAPEVVAHPGWVHV